ncbi:MAG TPA: hypothetical protein PK636_05350 [bacterium]|nr:hypothetical protein [bacterium]HPJ72090.1 hypothetical protein [bacterium]HPQ66021.1 hypothetical protein [bacterium]
MNAAAIKITMVILGALIVATRFPGVTHPARFRKGAAWLADVPGWAIRFAAVLVGAFGIWFLYSTVAVLIDRVPAFLLLAMVLGVFLSAALILAFFPRWFPQAVKALVAGRNNLFVRTICLLGVACGAGIILVALLS